MPMVKAVIRLAENGIKFVGKERLVGAATSSGSAFSPAPVRLCRAVETRLVGTHALRVRVGGLRVSR